MHKWSDVSVAGGSIGSNSPADAACSRATGRTGPSPSRRDGGSTSPCRRIGERVHLLGGAGRPLQVSEAGSQRSASRDGRLEEKVRSDGRKCDIPYRDSPVSSDAPVRASREGQLEHWTAEDASGDAHSKIGTSSLASTARRLSLSWNTSTLPSLRFVWCA